MENNQIASHSMNRTLLFLLSIHPEKHRKSILFAYRLVPSRFAPVQFADPRQRNAGFSYAFLQCLMIKRTGENDLSIFHMNLQHIIHADAGFQQHSLGEPDPQAVPPWFYLYFHVSLERIMKNYNLDAKSAEQYVLAEPAKETYIANKSNPVHFSKIRKTDPPG